MAGEYKIKVELDTSPIEAKLKEFEERLKNVTMGFGTGRNVVTDASERFMSKMAPAQDAMEDSGLVEKRPKKKDPDKDGVGEAEKATDTTGKKGGGILGMLGGISKGLAAIVGIGVSVAAITNLIIESSPLLKTTFKMINQMITMILRPIGDFFGAMLMPLVMQLMRIVMPISAENRQKAIEAGRRVADFLMEHGAKLGEMISAVLNWNPFAEPTQGVYEGPSLTLDEAELAKKLKEVGFLQEDDKGRVTVNMEMTPQEAAELLGVEPEEVEAVVESIGNVANKIVEMQAEMDRLAEEGIKVPPIFTEVVDENGNKLPMVNGKYQVMIHPNLITESGDDVTRNVGPSEHGEEPIIEEPTLADQIWKAIHGGLVSVWEQITKGGMPMATVAAAGMVPKGSPFVTPPAGPDMRGVHGPPDPNAAYPWLGVNAPEGAGDAMRKWIATTEESNRDLSQKVDDQAKQTDTNTQALTRSEEAMLNLASEISKLSREYGSQVYAPFSRDDGQIVGVGGIMPPGTARAGELTTVEGMEGMERLLAMLEFKRDNKEIDARGMAEEGKDGDLREAPEVDTSEMTDAAGGITDALNLAKSSADDGAAAMEEGAASLEEGAEAASDSASSAKDNATSVSENYASVTEMTMAMTEAWSESTEIINRKVAEITTNFSTMARKVAAALRQLEQILRDIKSAAAAAQSGGGSGGGHGSNAFSHSSLGYAKGGVINELIEGYGARTGTRYTFGEEGPEAIVPLSGAAQPFGGRGTAGTVVNATINVGTVVDRKTIDDIPEHLHLILAQKKRYGGL